MFEYEKKLINDAMNVAQVAELPKAVPPDSYVWIEGIAKIRLRDNSIAYGIVKRTPDLTQTVTYVNGATSSILSIEEVYPYVTIDKSGIKKFKKDDVDGRKEYLLSLNLPYEVNLEKANITDLNREIVKASLYQQLNPGK